RRNRRAGGRPGHLGRKPNQVEEESEGTLTGFPRPSRVALRKEPLLPVPSGTRGLVQTPGRIRMRRVTGSLLAALVLGAVLAAAITMGSAHAGARSAKKTTLTVWVGWSARELRVFKGVVADYQKKHRE